MTNTDIRFPCTFCNKTFGRKADQKRHEQGSTHMNVKPYACKECGKRFPQKTGLETHKNTHSGEKPHKCQHPGCGASFGDPSSRGRHYAEKHDKNKKPIPCPFPKCMTKIKRRYTFKEHLRNKHSFDRVGAESFMQKYFPKKRRSGRYSSVDADGEEEDDDDFSPGPVVGMLSNIDETSLHVPQINIHSMYSGIVTNNLMSDDYPPPPYDNYTTLQQNFAPSRLDIQAIYGGSLLRMQTPSSTSSLPYLSLSSSTSPSAPPSPAGCNDDLGYFDTSIPDGHCLFNNTVGMHPSSSYQHLQTTGISPMQLQISPLTKLDGLSLDFLPNDSGLRQDYRESEHMFDIMTNANMFHAPGVYSSYV